MTQMSKDLLSPAAGPTSASRRAYEFAKWAVLSGVYPAGSVVTEAALGRETGLSRTPVHAALTRLEVEGLVTMLPRRGALVSPFTLSDVEDVLEARVLVENHTAGRSFEHRATLLPQVEAPHVA